MFPRRSGATPAFSLLLLSVLLSACGGVTSRTDLGGAGVVYHLPRGVIDIELKAPKATPTSDFVVEIAGPHLVPDTAFRYRVSYAKDFFSDEDLVVETTPTGLLKNVSFESDDKTDEFVAKLGELGIEVFKAATFTPFGIAVPETEYVTLYRARVDPMDAAALAAASAAIKSKTSGLYDVGFVLRDIDRKPVTRPSALPAASACAASICYRPAGSYMLTVTEGGVDTQGVGLVLPDPTRIVGLTIERAAFVKTVTRMTFDGGVPSKLEVNKPNSALPIVEAPLSIAKSLTSLPAELLQLKIDLTEKETTALSKEKLKVEAAQDLQKTVAEAAEGQPSGMN